MAEFLRVFRVQGMDSNTTPKFQMVPKGHCRWVALRDGAGMTVTSQNTAVCTVHETTEARLPADDRAAGGSHTDRYFVLEGKLKGVTNIEARPATGAPLLLEINVKEKRQQLIQFNYLVDSTGRRATRPAADLGHWMPVLNYIWKRQANVEFVNHGVRDAPIARDLGATITLPAGSLGDVGDAIAAVGASGVNINVFLVWDLQDTRAGVDTDAVTTIGTANGSTIGTCIFEDDAGAGQPLSFAHEMGHHMGLDHDSHRQIDLMWGTTGERGLNLTKADVNTANP